MAAAPDTIAGRTGTTPQTGNRMPAWTLAVLVILIFGCFAVFSGAGWNPKVVVAIRAGAAFLLVFASILFSAAARAGRQLNYIFVPRPVHYVQMMAHSVIYLYWGAYWPEVYRHVPLILAQVAFAYAFDMLVCWARRDTWILGFGLFPIVFSTNLFLWFKDGWFCLQLLLIATGILGKEFIKWKRDGRLTHIFNPSAFSLFLFSVVLIATDSTQMTFGEQIATTMGRPPHIYLVIFLLGLVVQALFSVTLVTLSAAAALCLLNIAFTGWTGIYHFVDSNIPIAVFLGLHLLVTDPATSPRKAFGKIVFGGLYGAGVFVMYGVLGWLGAPRFYDKLLCVPALNLTVQALDRASDSIEKRLHALDLNAFRAVGAWSPRRLNFAYMSIWVALFTVMIGTGFVSGQHPGGTTEFWRTACNQGRWHACDTWAHTLTVTCNQNRGADCLTLGNMLVAKDPAAASGYLDQACDLGNRSGCASLQTLIERSGIDSFRQACDRGVAPGCYILGVQYQNGRNFVKDDARAFALFRLACAAGSARGCARMGEFYFLGMGAVVDRGKALEGFELACAGGYGPGCYNAGVLYRDGDAGRTNAAYGLQLIAQACEMGTQAACSPAK